MATLKDVARETGLGLGTVSRALTGHPNVRPETRRRVETAARELGYQSNGLARALRRNRTNSVGLIIPDLENEFYTTAASVVQRRLAVEGYRLVVACNENQPDADRALLTGLAESRVDGIIHVPCTPEGSATVRTTYPRLPVVEYARRSEAGGVQSVIGDDERGSALVVDHLVGLGHRQIALVVGPESLSTTIDRVAGFRRSVARHRLPRRGCPLMYGPTYSADFGKQATEQILDQHPDVTAIFVSSSRGALGALKALRERRLSVPRDMSLVGFLNPAWLDVSNPPLTTYELPLEVMGELSTRMILDRINGGEVPDTSQPHVLRCDGRLVVRSSTAAPRKGPLPTRR
ncbi:MAG: LacI family transcriptional regulator [Actinomycetota bacterium]|nr:LacI family transcriptional regulator [Actinomycetota bacterium]